MDLKTIKDNLPSFILAFIVLGGWSAINIRQQYGFSDKVSEFEKYKASEIAKLSAQELLIEKERVRLDAQAKGLNELSDKAAALANDAENKLNFVNKQEQRQTSIALRIQEESEIKSLIAAFSKLGINLNAAPACKPEEISKYNQAVSLMSQITGRVTAAGVYAKYRDFIETNRRQIYFSDSYCK